MDTKLKPTDIQETAARLAQIVHRTPVMTSSGMNKQTGGKLFLKCENFQRVGAFKFRGAYNAISRLTPAEKEAGVIAHSSGNHAQGVALAARLLETPAVIVMPHDAPAIKREATIAYGAEIVSCDAIDREKVTQELIVQHDYTLIHPFDNDDIIAGQGTAAWELFDEVGELDLLFVPVGGGGLISGCALAAAAASPRCRVIGVEPERAADAGQSWRQGKIYTLEQIPDTIADGLRPRAIGRRNLAIMRQYVHDMIAVSEEAILDSLAFIWQRLKIIVEPSAAVALAPLLSGQYNAAGRRVGVILSGGNIDPLSWRPSQPAGKTASQENIAAKAAGAPSDNDKKRPRILVCDPIDTAGLKILREVGDVDVKLNLNKEELRAIIGDYQALIVRNATHIPGQTIEYGYKLRAIGCVGGWLDNVDVSTARALGVEICYSPGSNTVAIAEHTLTLMLILSQRQNDAGVQYPARGLAGKTLGIIGFGRIGRQVAQRALAFDMRVLVNQPRLTPELALAAGVAACDLVELLQEADFVTLHVPFKAETETLIGARELALMKPTAFLINTAHTELVDDDALLAALNDERLAGAALATFAPRVEGGETRPSRPLRQHPRVIEAAHVTAFIGDRVQEASVAVARQIARVLQSKQPSETLSLEVAPIEQVLPHEQIDDKRVARLMSRLEEDGRLVNPPITSYWRGHYIILDGATRYTALKRLGYPYVIVQVVDPARHNFTLHTWYHAISSSQPVEEMFDLLAAIEGLELAPYPAEQVQTALRERREQDALCYFLQRDGRATLALVRPGADRLAVMNELVNAYTKWGRVERTLLTDLGRLMGQFPEMVAVAVFPQFKVETVFDTASRGDLLPAGLTRFVIPGRILRLYADLGRLKADEPLAAKRAWLNQFLEEKLARSRLRYYQEPVVLLDE